MKLTVKRKVANGLVVGFLLPPVAGTVAEALDIEFEGMNAYAAEDNFDIAVPEGVAVLQDLVADPCDPDGVDPSGVETACFVPESGIPILCIRAPTELTTAEDGTADFFEVYGDDPDDPSGTYLYYIESSRTREAKPEVEAIVLGVDSCSPHPIWVTGQNDGYVDGDSPYLIRILNELGEMEAYVNGVNIDNDHVDGVTLYMWGPKWLGPGNNGSYTVNLYNYGGEPITGYDLLIEPSSGLDINEFTVTGSGTFKEPAKAFKGRGLRLKDVKLNWDDLIEVSLEIEMASGGQSDKTLKARLVGKDGYDENDTSLNVRTSLR